MPGLDATERAKELRERVYEEETGRVLVSKYKGIRQRKPIRKDSLSKYFGRDRAIGEHPKDYNEEFVYLRRTSKGL